MKKGKGKSADALKLFGVAILFVFAFVLLINRQRDNSLGDVALREFDVHTITNKQLVVKDNNIIYPKYYVIYFNNKDNSYIIHSFNYYNSKDQYDLEFNRLSKSMIDYDYYSYFIRELYTSGYGSYDEVKNNLSLIFDSNNLEVYE